MTFTISDRAKGVKYTYTFKTVDNQFKNRIEIDLQSYTARLEEDNSLLQVWDDTNPACLNTASYDDIIVPNFIIEQVFQKFQSSLVFLL